MKITNTDGVLMLEANNTRRGILANSILVLEKMSELQKIGMEQLCPYRLHSLIENTAQELTISCEAVRDCYDVARDASGDNKFRLWTPSVGPNPSAIDAFVKVLKKKRIAALAELNVKSESTPAASPVATVAREALGVYMRPEVPAPVEEDDDAEVPIPTIEEAMSTVMMTLIRQNEDLTKIVGSIPEVLSRLTDIQAMVGVLSAQNTELRAELETVKEPLTFVHVEDPDAALKEELSDRRDDSTAEVVNDVWTAVKQCQDDSTAVLEIAREYEAKVMAQDLAIRILENKQAEDAGAISALKLAVKQLLSAQGTATQQLVELNKLPARVVALEETLLNMTKRYKMPVEHIKVAK